MKKYITLIRPVNFIITGASIYVACLLAGGTHDQFIPMLFASLSGAFIGAGGMVINDIFDIEIDRINKPDRPLPSGAIAKYDAVMIYGGLTGAGLIVTSYTTLGAVIIAFAAVPVIFLYSYRLKGTPLIGNITVGALTGLTFIFGGAAVGNVSKAVFPALFAFLINVGRELIKDMEDIDGDAKNNIKTYPIVFGMKNAAILSTVLLLAVIVSTTIPFKMDIYGVKFFVTAAVGVDAVIVYVIYSLWKDRSPKNMNRLSTILKWDMLIGLIAIYLG